MDSNAEPFCARYARRQLLVEKQREAAVAAREAAEQRLELYDAHRRLLDAKAVIAWQEGNLWKAQEGLCDVLVAHVHCLDSDTDTDPAAGEQTTIGDDVNEVEATDTATGRSTSAKRARLTSSTSAAYGMSSQPRHLLEENRDSAGARWAPPQPLERSEQLAAEARRDQQRLRAQIAELERQRQAVGDRIPEGLSMLQGKRAELRALKALHATCPSRVSGSVLPETVLLDIFKLLTKEDLVSRARPVCSRWLRVSEDRSLWRDVHYDLTGTRSLKRMIMEMRAAPFIDSLNVSRLNHTRAETLQRNFLDFEWNGKLNKLIVGTSASYFPNIPQPLWSQLLDKFSGTVTSVEVRQDVSSRTLTQIRVRKFLKFVSEAPLLRSLRVSCSAIFSYRTPVQVYPRCLETLDIAKCSKVNTTLLVSIISASERSLKAVRLPELEGSWDSGPVMHALAECSLLQDVAVPMCKEITALSACTAVTSLELRDPRHLPDVDRFIRSQAGGTLRSLKIRSSFDNKNALLPAVKVLSQLTSLELHSGYDLDVADLLKCLPALEHLRVSSFPMSAADVRAVTADPSLAPGLRFLYVKHYSFPYNINPGECDVVKEAVDELLKQRPNLRCSFESA